MTEKQIESTEISEEGIILEVIRETGKDANWLNRFCRRTDSNVPLHMNNK